MLIAAEPILNDLRSHPDVIRCDIAGSLRRGKEVSGDIDFLGPPRTARTSSRPSPRATAFSASASAHQGRVCSRAVFRPICVVEDSERARRGVFHRQQRAQHRVRQRAIDRGLRLNEYGLFKSTEETRDPELRLDCKTEEDIFAALDLTYVPPELREDRGEFDAAENGHPAPC